jgi:hypothetical protein
LNVVGTPNPTERSSKSFRVGSKLSKKTLVNESDCGFALFFRVFSQSRDSVPRETHLRRASVSVIHKACETHLEASFIDAFAGSMAWRPTKPDG